MVDALSTKKQTPGQMEHRRQWIIDTVRANQCEVSLILDYVSMDDPDILGARGTLEYMHKGDRDAILQPNGILTSEQIEALK